MRKEKEHWDQYTWVKSCEVGANSTLMAIFSLRLVFSPYRYPPVGVLTIPVNGIGIPDDLQKDVFNMFFRATNQASGSGLGLYTVKHCIKK